MIYEGVLEGKHFRSHQAPEFGIQTLVLFYKRTFYDNYIGCQKLIYV